MSECFYCDIHIFSACHCKYSHEHYPQNQPAGELTHIILILIPILIIINSSILLSIRGPWDESSCFLGGPRVQVMTEQNAVYQLIPYDLM